jgi:methionine aminopeptidase
LVRRIIGEARYTAGRIGIVDNVSGASIETEDELDGLRRAGHVVAVVLRGAGGPEIREGTDGWTYRTADGALAAHAEHTIVVTGGRPLVLTA